MAYDYEVDRPSGDKRPLYGTATAPAGYTVTLTGAGTFTLFDATGAIVTNFNAIPATGYDGGALLTARTWFNFDTTGLATGYYTSLHSFPGTATTDNLPRVFEVRGQIDILPPVEVVASYDLTTPVGQTRLYFADTVASDAVFSDAELLRYLADTGGVPRIAAATALETAAADAAKVAVIAKNVDISTDVSKISGMLLASAQRLRDNYAPVAVVISNDQIWSMSTGNGLTPGTMTIW